MINPKVITYVLLFCLVILVVSMSYICMFGVYGELTRTKLYTVEVVQALLVPAAGILAALLMGLAKKKDDSSDK